MLQTHHLGFLCISLSVICNGLTFHVQKAALTGCRPAMLIFIQGMLSAAFFFMAGSIWRLAGWTAGDMHKVSPLSTVKWFKGGVWIIVLAMAMGGGGGWLQQITVDQYGPEIAAFLGNLKLVILVCAGLMLGERISKAEFVTACVILAGAFMFSWRDGELQTGALIFMTIAGLVVAGKQLIVRRAADKANLPTVMAGMLVGMSAWNGVIAVINNEVAIPNLPTLGLIALAALLNGVIGMALLYISYNLIGVSRAAPIDAMRPMVVLVVGIAFLGAGIPGWLQCSGAAMVVGGSMLLAKLHKPAPKPGINEVPDVDDEAMKPTKSN